MVVEIDYYNGSFCVQFARLKTHHPSLYLAVKDALRIVKTTSTIGIRITQTAATVAAIQNF